MEFTKKVLPKMGDKGKEIHFIQDTSNEDEKPFPPFCFIAAGNGVRWEGKTTTLRDMNDLQDMARVASEAWTEHLKLKPQIEITRELPAPEAMKLETADIKP